ncbi:GGDEF domain-containing protein [Sporolactobacillus laevolacticus]|uniref:Diguanylate cyclase n=1 Tax=Sporolactobacillus laevolacticus DSM 442 TaxID=1395513 RepID=V6IW26_9BACL|nr:GGDEF domain-containing protein [Sporolactobacillus laevolacticus]EST11427.1 diguanylate cyclase [Sporolactobacillus laevolacticus DSM 442]
MNNTAVNELDKIIGERQIKTVFQPIVSLRDGEIHGFEALSRVTCPSLLSNPEQLFQTALAYNRIWDLDDLCRSTALHTIREQSSFSKNHHLFLNINPNIMKNDQFSFYFTRQYLEQFGIKPNQIVFEITERDSVTDMERFKNTILHFKSNGFRIAIDDAGAMYSGLNLITDTQPHYIKLDRRLIQGIDLGKLNFALVKGLAEFCRISNIFLIAEGVETQSELHCLMDLGVPFAQGYFLRKPAEQLHEIDDGIKKIITDFHKSKHNVFGNPSANSYIANICTPTETISMGMRVERVLDKLKADPDSIGFCVVKDGRVKGIVTKLHVTLNISGRYGFSLYQHQPIAQLMDSDFISVDYRMPINEVSKIAMSRAQEKLYDFIVVTKNDKYLGTVTIKDLLQKTTEIEVIKAKYENPLTGLPGNLVIEQKMKQYLLEKKTFGILYLDINHFKEYNDVYGFENGDRVIKLLADILVSYLPLGQFVGHVGGDDFVAILNSEDLHYYCEQVSNEFQRKVLHHYSPQDLEKGYIIAENRLGITEKFSIVSVSIAGIYSQCLNGTNMIELTEKLARLKKKSKRQKESNYLLIEM